MVIIHADGDVFADAVCFDGVDDAGEGLADEGGEYLGHHKFHYPTATTSYLCSLRWELFCHSSKRKAKSDLHRDTRHTLQAFLFPLVPPASPNNFGSGIQGVFA